MPRRVTKAGGEAFDSLTVHDAVGNEAHCTTGDVAADIPLRALGGGIGQAAFAGTESGLVSGGRGEEKANVTGFRSARRAGGTAVDAGGRDTKEKMTVETGVAGADSTITFFKRDLCGWARGYHGSSTSGCEVLF